MNREGGVREGKDGKARSSKMAAQGCVVGLEEGMKGQGGDEQSKGISRGQTKTDSSRNSIGGDKDGSSCMTLGIL